MRLIPVETRDSSARFGNSAKLIPQEERKTYLDKFYQLRTSDSQNKQREVKACIKEIKGRYEHSLTLLERVHCVSCIYRVADPLSVPDSYLYEYMQMSMNLPYVRESATGLAVEAFIKRLELACQVAADSNKRKKAMAERTPDFSVLEAFRDDDFQNVISMNNEWLAHHDDPEYDHGAPMYWFPDLDQALESTIQNVKLQLINIAMMYNYPEQQRNAWDILYTWKEYISSK